LNVPVHVTILKEHLQEKGETTKTKPVQYRMAVKKDDVFFSSYFPSLFFIAKYMITVERACAYYDHIYKLVCERRHKVWVREIIQQQTTTTHY